MKIKKIQNDYGQFNMIGNEKSTVFSVAIFTDDNKVLEIGGTKCILYYSREEDVRSDFDDALENLSWVFEKCWDYAGRVWGSTDYKAQCIAFMKAFRDNYEELRENYVKLEGEAIQKKIERLQTELSSLALPQPDFNWAIKREIEKYEKWVASSTLELEQLKPESEKFLAEQKKIDGYKAKVAELQPLIVQE